LTASQARRKSIVRQSGLTSIAAGAAVVAGLVLDLSIAARFGAGRATDSFFVGSRIPIGLGAVLMVAANQALVPMVSTRLTERGEEYTWRFVSLLFTAVIVLGAVFWGVAVALAFPLMRVTAPGLARSEIVTATEVARIMFLLVPLIGLAELMRALLNARYRFVAPAAMNVVMNGLAATLILFFAHRDLQRVAWAYVIGAVAQLLFMLGVAYREHFRYRIRLDLRDPDVVEMGKLSVRPIVAAGLNPLESVVEQSFASFLPAGSITIINYAYRLISALGGTVFFRSVVVALIPRLTEATTKKNERQVSHITVLGVQIMFVLSMPLTAFVVVLSHPTIRVLFSRGRFSPHDAALLAVVLSVYASSLIGAGVQRALLAPFFARLDTRVPLRNSLYGNIFNIAMLPTVLLFRGNDFAVICVAIAFSITQYINVAHAWFRLRKIVNRPLAGIAPWLLRVTAATLVQTAVLVALYHLLDLGGHPGRFVLVPRIAVAGVAGLIAFAGALALFGGEQAGATLRARRREIHENVTDPPMVVGAAPDTPI
jgi:murein biosynthesis integral membrane protein MurJ